MLPRATVFSGELNPPPNYSPEVPIGGQMDFQNIQSKEVIIMMKNQMRRGVHAIGELKKYFKDYLPWFKQTYQKR
jgi:hypothetical protein